MDAHEVFQLFIERLTARLGEVVEAELTEVRLRDEQLWMHLYHQLQSVIEPPACGTVGQQVQVVRAKLDYLCQETGPRLPKLVALVFGHVDQHYRTHRKELQAAIDEFTLDGSSPTSQVNKLIEDLDKPD